MKNKDSCLYGNPVSNGIAVAKAYIYEKGNFEIACEKCENAETEVIKLKNAVDAAKDELDELYFSLKDVNPENAKIFVAHKELLDDEEMLTETYDMIKDSCVTAEFAVQTVFNEYAKLLGRVKDTVISGRSADLIDVKERVLRILTGTREKSLARFNEDVIVVSHELLPSDTANLDKNHVKGIITECGGMNSHSAILARSFRIPAVLGINDAVKNIKDGQMLILDGNAGEVKLEFSEKERFEYEQKREELKHIADEEKKYLKEKCKTRDDVTISIGINVGNDKLDTDDEAYDFVGLLRSEFLYMESDHMPTEEEQFEAYRKILETANKKTVTLRTLDIGGDKTLPYFSLPKEDNPFLGERALRLCFKYPDIFKTQLRAALRASVYGKLQIMFPMVGSIEDFRKAKSVVKEVMSEFDSKGISYDSQIKIGVMIEIPGLALVSDLIAKEADFASIGSNDLTQYTCAADRMNEGTAKYYESLSPAMLRLFKFIFESFRANKKPVSVCGEIAGNPKIAALLVGLGARKLSMNYASVAAVKAEIAKYTLTETVNMANDALNLCTEEEIKKRMGL